MGPAGERAWGGEADPSARDATILYRAARVHVPGGPTSADALLVRGDTIAAVGPFATLAAQVGQETREVDHRPSAILPGLIDAHCHIAQLGYLSAAADVGPIAASDIPALQHILTAAAPDTSGWIVAHGYVEYELRERRSPTRADLDEAVGDVPCVIYQASLHTCVVNTAALRILGIDGSTPDPKGGEYGRDADGGLDGRLIEAPMFALFGSAISDRLARAGHTLVSAATAHLAAFGITSCVDANTTWDELTALVEASSRGSLAIRVGSLVRYEDLDRVIGTDALAAVDPHRLAVTGTKLFADGGMSSRTAAVEPPYEHPAGEAGMLLLDASELADATRRAADSGIGVGVHAQGERAIRATIEAFASVGSAGPDLRRIEHGGAFALALLRMAEGRGITVVSQPAFLRALGDGFVEAFGPERSSYLYPFRSLAEHGIEVAFSSDAPVVTASPWAGVRDAGLRTTRKGVTIGGPERLTVAQAIERYTVGGSSSGIPAPDVGVLAAGRPADFIVAEDPLSMPLERIADIGVTATYIGGRRIDAQTT